jgi:hypothetical protein
MHSLYVIEMNNSQNKIKGIDSLLINIIQINIIESIMTKIITAIFIREKKDWIFLL